MFALGFPSQLVAWPSRHALSLRQIRKGAMRLNSSCLRRDEMLMNAVGRELANQVGNWCGNPERCSFQASKQGLNLLKRH